MNKMSLRKLQAEMKALINWFCQKLPEFLQHILFYEHAKCHYSITYALFNLFLTFHLPFYLKVFHKKEIMRSDLSIN